MTVRRGYAEGRFGQIHYRISGEGKGDAPPLVCCHMSPVSSRWYERFMAEAGRERLVIAPDNPGYGNSDPTRDHPSIADFAGSAQDLLDGLGIDRFDVMGYHTGTCVAAELARSLPRRVGKGVLVSAPALYTEEERRSVDWVLQPRHYDAEGQFVLKEWLHSVRNAGPGWTLEMMSRHYPDWMLRPDTRWFAFQAVFRYPLVETLRALRQPVLLLCPDDDLVVQTDRVAAAVPTLQYKRLAPWGRGFLDVWPAESAALVSAFLDRPAAAAP